ncbi:hypothetical protein [Staphylococcus caprae]|nr:hypothetical protein [Staphylococcus caprae]
MKIFTIARGINSKILLNHAFIIFMLLSVENKIQTPKGNYILKDQY